ncbi:MAG: DNA repair protein RecO [Candidatus Latescibacterota bacterium]|nr:MAG: DNA repair protein RecO [Candidatus Latescibacterota bacterium]
MIRKDEGVVLKSARSGETSKLVTFLGRESGKTRLVAKGALGAKSAFRGMLEPGTHLEVVYYHKEGRTQYFLKEAHVHSALRTETYTITRLAATLAVLELLDHVCFWESPEPRIVNLLLEYLRCSTDNDPLFSFLVFQFNLLGVLGALPEFSSCALCGESLNDGFFHPAEGGSACRDHSESSSRRVWMDKELLSLIAKIGDSPVAELRKLTVGTELRKDLGAILHWTYTYHVNDYRLPDALKLIPKDKRATD